MLDEILECPVDDFFNHYSPYSPSRESINRAFGALQKNQLLVPRKSSEEFCEGTDNIWTCTDLITPLSRCGAMEISRSQHLQDITNTLRTVQCVDESSGAERQSRFYFKDYISTTPEIQGANSWVDACITRVPEKKEVAPHNIAAAVVFKKNSGTDDTKDSRLMLISAANRVMNDDPRRTWIYGITIGDKEIDIWYFCRSHVVKSESFDFTTDIKRFIRVFLPFLFATEQEIGYDPTVHRVEHSREIGYVYEVGTVQAPRYFRTHKILYTARSSYITGRKTRIWEVVEVEHLGDGRFGRDISGEVVLKDGWLDENFRSEKEAQTAMFDNLSNIQPSDYGWASGFLHQRLSEAFQGDKYKGYFMEVLDSRRIGKTKPRLQSAKGGGLTQSGDHLGTQTDVPGQFFRPREYKTKEQHRLIYRHVGCALNKVKDLSTSFRAIHDTFIGAFSRLPLGAVGIDIQRALVLLYLAGWTHGDISVGNIIVVEKDGSIQGKLSDLEFAKEFADTSFDGDSKTGTAYFMPLEIHRSRTIYAPPQELYSTAPQMNPFAPRSKLPLPKSHERGRETPPVKFRFQHDLESLWWVALWILLYRVGGNEALELAGEIFLCSDTPSRAREIFFTEHGDGLTGYIHKELEILVPPMLDIRAVLFNSYRSKEKSENLMDPAHYRQIYVDVWARFTMLIHGALHIEGICFQNPKCAEEETKKRARSESESESGDYIPQIPQKQRK